MQLTLERPGDTYTLRGADGESALVNNRRLVASFIVSPTTLIEDWPAVAAGLLTPELMQPLLALGPDVIIIGTGARQAFAPALTQAHCLRAGVGLELMTNAAAARTFNVLAGEGRNFVAAFILG